MEKITINAENVADAITICAYVYRWTPDAVREVDSGDENTRAFMCFETASDAVIWDNQK